MKFSEIIDELKSGKLARRKSWAEGTYAVKCPDTYVSTINCLPASAKLKLMNASSKVKVDGSVKLIQVTNPGMFNSSSSVGEYNLTWTDVFAEDWELD